MSDEEKIKALQAEVEQEKAKTAIVEQMRRNAVQGREAAEAKAEALLNLLRRIQPHLPAIICYASTCGEHEQNQIAVDVNQALAAGEERHG